MPETPKDEELTKRINKLEREISDSKRKSSTYSKQVRKETEGTNKAAVALASAMRGVSDSFRDIGVIWLGSRILPSLSEMASNLVNTSKELHRNVVNAGMLGSQLSSAKRIVSDLQVGFGATYIDAAKVVGILSQKQYAGNLKEAAVASYQFARATGLGYDEVANLTVGLQKEGQIGSKAMTAMYADLIKIQQSNGLTKNGMTQTINTIQRMSNQMRAFGKTEIEIRRMASSTGKLISSLEKVGVTADWATGFIEKMTNPENIEENIAAYSQLGISISDALSGNFDMSQMQNGLKEFGQKLKQMGPIAGAAYAKSFGISYKEAIKAADMQGATEEQLTPEETAAQTLKELTENTKNIAEKIGDAVNIIIGKFMKLGPIILTLFAVLKKPIMNFISELFSSTVKKAEESAKEVGEVYSSENNKFFDDLIKKQDEYYNIQKNNISEVAKKLKNSGKEEENFLSGMYSTKQIANAKKSIVEAMEDIKAKRTSLGDSYLGNMSKLQKQLDTAKEIGAKKEEQRIEKLIEAERKRYNDGMKALNVQEKKAENLQKILKNAVPKTSYRERAIKEGQNKQKDILNSIRPLGTRKKSIIMPDGTTKKTIGRLEAAAKLLGQKTITSVSATVGGIKDLDESVKDNTKKILSSAKDATTGFFKGIPGKIKEAVRIKTPEEKTAKKEAKKKKREEREENGKDGKLAGVGKAIGVIGIIAGLLVKLLSSFPEFQETINDIKTNVLEALKKILAPIMKVFKEIMPTIAAVLSTLIDTLGPVIGEIIGVLGDVVGTLLENIAPILGVVIKLVGFVLKPIMNILKNIMPLISDLLNVVMIALMPVLGIIGVALRIISPVLKLVSWALQMLLKPIVFLAELFGKDKTLKDNNDLLKKNNENLEKSTEAKPQEVSTDKNGNIWIKKAVSSGEVVSTSAKVTSTSETANSKTNSTTNNSSNFERLIKQNNENLILAMKDVLGANNVIVKDGWQMLGNSFRNGFNVVINDNSVKKAGKVIAFGEYTRGEVGV